MSNSAFPPSLFYSFDLLTIMLLPFWMYSTAPLTNSSTISRALFFSFTTAAALPIRKGRALSICSSVMSAYHVSNKFRHKARELLTIAHRFKVVLDRDGARLRQRLDLRLAIRLPVVDILVITNSQRATSEDNRTDVVVKARCPDSFLVCLWRTRLLGENEPGTDPNS